MFRSHQEHANTQAADKALGLFVKTVITSSPLLPQRQKQIPANVRVITTVQRRSRQWIPGSAETRRRLVRFHSLHAHTVICTAGL